MVSDAGADGSSARSKTASVGIRCGQGWWSGSRDAGRNGAKAILTHSFKAASYVLAATASAALLLRISNPGGAARASVHVQTASQTADQTAWPDPPRRLSLEGAAAVKRHLASSADREGARNPDRRIWRAALALLAFESVRGPADGRRAARVTPEGDIRPRHR